MEVIFIPSFVRLMCSLDLSHTLK